MARYTPKYLSEYLTSQLGYGGAFGTGGGDEFIASQGLESQLVDMARSYGINDIGANNPLITDIPQINFEGGVQPLSVATASPLQTLAANELGDGAGTQYGQNVSQQVGGRVDSSLANLTKYYDMATGLMGGQGFANRMQELQNPYQQQVVDSALADLYRAGDQQEMKLRQEANRFASFSGSPQSEIARGQLASDITRQAGDLSGRMRFEGYGQALNQLGGQINALSGMGGQIGQAGLQGAQLVGGAESQGLQNFLNLQTARAGMGSDIRNINQQQIGAAMGEYFAPQEYPWQQVNRATGALSNIYNPTSAQQLQAVTQPSTAQNLMGGAMAGGAIGNQLSGMFGNTQSNPFASVNNAATAGFMGMF